MLLHRRWANASCALTSDAKFYTDPIETTEPWAFLRGRPNNNKMSSDRSVPDLKIYMPMTLCQRTDI